MSRAVVAPLVFYLTPSAVLLAWFGSLGYMIWELIK